MEIFNQVLEECKLSDLGFFGPKFTWCNLKEENELVRERLDRVTASPGWRDLFPYAWVDVLAACSSDHALITISLGAQQNR